MLQKGELMAEDATEERVRNTPIFTGMGRDVIALGLARSIIKNKNDSTSSFCITIINSMK